MVLPPRVGGATGSGTDSRGGFGLGLAGRLGFVGLGLDRGGGHGHGLAAAEELDQLLFALQAQMDLLAVALPEAAPRRSPERNNRRIRTSCFVTIAQVDE